jgi:hypothetical protein
VGEANRDFGGGGGGEKVPALGRRESARGGLGNPGPVDPRDVAGRAAPLLGRAVVVVGNGRQPEEGDESDSDRDGPARTQKGARQPKPERVSRHGAEG